MLDPNYLTEITKGLEELFANLEIEILSDVARRISMNDYSMTSTAQYQINQLKALGKSNEEINKIIAEKLNVTLKKVNRIMNNSVYMSLDSDNDIFKQAFNEGAIPSFNYKASSFKELILKGVEATNGEIRNICKSTAKTAQQAFTKTTDYVYLSVKSGAFDMDTAITNAIKDLSKQGLSYIDYDSGVRRRLDSAIRNAVRTGVNQTTLKCQDKNFEEMGGNLVVTSSHSGARYEHALWQGQIFWRKSKVKGYKNFETATGYGTGAGLGGWNCRHSYYPYFEGISANPFDKINEEDNAKEYELTQEQRYNERMIRDWDRRRKVCDAAGVDSSKENAKYREWRAKQKELLDSNPQLKRNFAREKGYLLKNIDNSIKRDIIKDGKKAKNMGNYKTLGKLDKNKLENEFGNINSDKIILMDERDKHIKDRHPDDYEYFHQYKDSCLSNPDYIVKDNKNQGTINVISKIPNSNLNILIRLVLDDDSKGYENSIMTAFRMSDKKIKKMIEKNKVIYKKE